MKNLTCAHWFVAGMFTSVALSGALAPSIILASTLIIFWGNFTIPLILALFIDTAFIHTRELVNMFGFMLTFGTLLLTVILLPLRKFLKF